jgi:hypothetical protein
MDPTGNQDELMHELICGSTGHIAPEFHEDENDGSQFLTTRSKILVGRKKKMSRKPRYEI